ncbi:hypothetical protein Tco_1534373, partial [Tanacetum coccineum]
YGFIGTLDAKTRRQRAEEVSYGIIYVWVDPIGADEEDRQTQLFQRFDGLVKDRQFHYETARLLDQKALDSYPDAGLSYRLTGVTDDDIYCTGLITTGTNNMPPRRSSATARVAAIAVVAATLMTAVVEQLIEARVYASLANHDTL